MASVKLREALKDCLIDFDRRVLVTDILQEYKIEYKDVEKVLLEYLERKEAVGIKYEKRYLVHGFPKDPEHKHKTELYTIANGESELQNWLTKLKDAESSLYSVEIAGGAKAPAQILKPIKFCIVKLENSPRRLSTTNVNGHANGNDVNATKSKNNDKCEEGKPNNLVTKQSPTTKDKKPESKTVHSFFSASSSKTNVAKEANPKEKTIPSKKGDATSDSGKDKKTEEKPKSVMKPSTPKKMEDFFKNSAVEKLKKEKEGSANTSKQLFSDEEESSDEEEKMDRIRRNIMSTDDLDEQIGNAKIKRKRILDSDDEDDEPQHKHEKTESVETISDSTPASTSANQESTSEMYEDEEGFIITTKIKKSQSSVVRQEATKNSTSASSGTSSRSPPKPSKSPYTGKSKSAASKTKQKDIMSFFSKK